MFKSFRTETAKKNNGHFLKEINGEMKDVYYSYEKTSGWYVFTLINEDVITDQTAQTNQLAFVLVIRIACILVVLAYFLMLWERKQSKEVKRRMIEMNTILSNSPGGAMCYMIDHGKLTLQFISEGACEIFGFNLAEAREKLMRGYSAYIHSEDYHDDMLLSSENGIPELYYRIITPKNHVKWIVDRRSYIEDHDVRYIYISILDVTNMMNMQEELLVSEAKQRMILEDTNLMYFDYEIDKNEIHFSKGWMEYSGYPEKISIASNNPAFAFNLGKVSLSKEEMIAYVNEHGHNFQVDDKLNLMNGTQRWLRMKGSIIFDQRNIPTHIIAVMEDIDDMKRVHEELEEKTMIDGLTGIYNKESAEKFIRQKLSETTLLTQQVLFVIDVDNFKDVNDTFGHLEGDEVLSQLGFKLNGCFRKDDIVGRIGGDEFIALMSDVNLDANEAIEERAKQIIQAVEEVTGKNVDVNVTCSVGIAIYPKDGNDYDELFRKADAAMYHMKVSGKSNYSFYQK